MLVGWLVGEKGFRNKRKKTNFKLPLIPGNGKIKE